MVDRVRRRPLVALVAFVAVAVALAGCQADAEPRPELPFGTVVRVVDGDTMVIRLDGRDERVRLIGIDTPESVRPNSPVECYGKEASAFLEALTPAGSQVRLERDVEARDVYDRLLAYVYRADDDLFVNLEIVTQGFGQPLTIPPNVAHTERFVQASRDARDAGRGLWSACRG